MKREGPGGGSLIKVISEIWRQGKRALMAFDAKAHYRSRRLRVRALQAVLAALEPKKGRVNR